MFLLWRQNQHHVVNSKGKGRGRTKEQEYEEFGDTIFCPVKPFSSLGAASQIPAGQVESEPQWTPMCLPDFKLWKRGVGKEGWKKKNQKVNLDHGPCTLKKGFVKNKSPTRLVFYKWTRDSESFQKKSSDGLGAEVSLVKAPGGEWAIYINSLPLMWDILSQNRKEKRP